MVNTAVINTSIKIMFDNFDDIMQYVEKCYNIDNDEPYYKFVAKIISGLYSNEITFELECSQYLNDAVKIIHMDDKPHVSNWIILNETNYGVVVFVEHSSKDIRSIVFDTSGKMILRSYKKENTEFDIPLTDDEYFNISVLHGIDLSLSNIQYINDFIQTNKKIIDEYKILLEHSAYEV